MKKRTRLLYGLLLLCAPLAGCLKEDDGSQFYSDVYWFPLAKQTFSVDTREPEPVDTVVLVFRARNFVYDSDTVNFAVMPDSTTAVAGTDYEITTPVVRFGKDDYYDNLLRGEIGLRIYPTLSDTLTLALKLIYSRPANAAAAPLCTTGPYRRADRSHSLPSRPGRTGRSYRGNSRRSRYIVRQPLGANGSSYARFVARLRENAADEKQHTRFSRTAP